MKLYIKKNVIAIAMYEDISMTLLMNSGSNNLPIFTKFTYINHIKRLRSTYQWPVDNKEQEDDKEQVKDAFIVRFLDP